MNSTLQSLSFKLDEANKKHLESMAEYYRVVQQLRTSDEDILEKVRAEWLTHVAEHQRLQKEQKEQVDRSESEVQNLIVQNSQLSRDAKPLQSQLEQCQGELSSTWEPPAGSGRELTVETRGLRPRVQPGFSTTGPYYTRTELCNRLVGIGCRSQI